MSARHRHAKQQLRDLRHQLARVERVIEAYDVVIDDLRTGDRRLWDRRQGHVLKKIQIQAQIEAWRLPT